ncbi:MAG: hypothetical protein COU63_00865 [Candidatus Pacebacteria bacterium CG10_big_fil_rev_8_21_14_0_10_36_11]|nr:FtsW/RodA/SpoVE family cell cycle protein [Candidatus Pacearchaeota archaeon]OIP74570.1 MAG: hypothetical protein AUK08_00465 [Candidatus Pacebacteria bacterium CG2_30_36_39]PIR65197.1 MAG: hypothetical protein COU63_00865 [Candidatus Pacebacteria bacterium CG10_big_fil_rev_8_21_14_0_10_36_11]
MRLWFIPLVTTALGAFSIVTLMSVSPDLMQRQLAFWLISFGIFFVLARTPLHFWWSWGHLIWKFLMIVLLVLLIFGRATRGATAWVDLGWGLKFQPSQFALLSFLLVVLPAFSKHKMLKESQLLELLWYLLVPVVLILAEPDFGTALLYGLGASVVFFWQKIPKQYLNFLWLSVLSILIIGWFFILKPYQKLRVTSFFTGYRYEQDAASYNARQSLIAVGSGQVWGKGLGKGTQSQLRFLPERQTDFIFASLAEESGLVGSVIIIGLYALLFFFLLNQALVINNNESFLFILAILAYFFTQTMINIGMNMGMLPITGVTLPFVSYGGSSLLSSMVLLGFVQRILIENPVKKHLRIT